MYNCLIVDDEMLLCEALKSKLLRLKAQSGLAIGEIAIANSVDQALEQVQHSQTDVILTDMKMPGKSGIKLIEELNLLKYPAKVVVISGYDDYQYVRNAFNLGAVDYLLKPVNLENLREKMEQVFAQIEGEKTREQSNVDHEKQLFTYHLEKQLNQYLTVGADLTAFLQSEPFLDSFPHKYFAAALFSCDMDAPSSAGLEELHARRQGENRFRGILVKNPDGASVMVFNFCEPNDLIAVQDYLEQLCQELSIYSSLSESSLGLEDFKKLYRQVMDSIKYHLLEDFTVRIYSEGDEKQLSELPKPIPEKIDFLFKKQDFSDIRSFIYEQYQAQNLESKTPQYLEKLYDVLFFKMGMLADEYHFNIGDFVKKPFYGFGNVNEVVIALRNAVNLLQQFYTEHLGREKSIVDIVKRYIEENYQHYINMSEIASMVSVSYTYFSRMFKQETGKSFSEYLTDVRMLHAKKLMEDPTLKIKTIAELTGYDSVYSFSRAFSQYYGMSAREWRNQL